MKKLILIISCWMACLASCYANNEQMFVEKEKNAFRQIDQKKWSVVYDKNQGFIWAEIKLLFGNNTITIAKWEAFSLTLDSLYKNFPTGKEKVGLQDKTRTTFLNSLKQQILEKKPSTKPYPSAPATTVSNSPSIIESDTTTEFVLLQAFGILKENYKDFYDSWGLKYDTILKSLSIVDCYSNDISRIQAIDKLEKVYHSNQSKKTKLDAFKIGYQSERRNKKRIGGAVLLTVILVVTVWFIAEYSKNKKKERKADKSLPPVVGSGGTTTGVVPPLPPVVVPPPPVVVPPLPPVVVPPLPPVVVLSPSVGVVLPLVDVVRYAANPNGNFFRAERLSEDKNPDSSNFQIIYEIEKNSDGTIKKSSDGTYNLIEERKEYIATNKKDILLENIAKKDGSVLGKTIVKVIPGRVTRVTRKDKDGNDKDDWEIDPNKLLHIYFG